MKTFRTLDLAIEFYDLTQQVVVTGHMKDQLQRASSAIAINLSEGNAKGSANEKRHFFQTSYASLRECQTILKLLKVDDRLINDRADQLGANLYRLVNSNIKNSPNWRKAES